MKDMNARTKRVYDEIGNDAKAFEKYMFGNPVYAHFEMGNLAISFTGIGEDVMQGEKVLATVEFGNVTVYESLFNESQLDLLNEIAGNQKFVMRKLGLSKEDK